MFVSFGRSYELVFQSDWLPKWKEWNMRKQEVIELSLW